MTPHAPHAPGDIVRDRQSQKDYIIESITAVGGGGLIVYSLAGVIDDALETVWTHSDQQFTEQYLHITHNISEQHPRQILSDLRDSFKQMFGQDQILNEKLQHAENTVLRDIIYVADKGGEEDFHRGIIDLANSLVLGGVKPDKNTIKRLLTDLSDNSLGEEFIQNLTDRINNQLVSASIKSGNRKLLTEGSYQDLLLFSKQEYAIGKESGIFSRQIVEAKLPKLPEPARRAVEAIFRDREFGTRSFGWEALDETHKGIERALLVYRELFRELTGKKLSPYMEAAIKSNFYEARKYLALGKATPIVQLLVKQMGVTEASNLTEFRGGSKISQLGYEAVNAYKAGRASTGVYTGLGKISSRLSVVNTLPRKRGSFRPKVNWEAIMKHPRLSRAAEGRRQASLYSIDFNTVLNDLIGESKFTLTHGTDSLKYSLRTKEGKEAIQMALKTSEGTGSLVLSRHQLEILLKQKELNVPIELADVLLSSGALQSNMTASVRASIRGIHYSGTRLDLPIGERIAEVLVNKADLGRALKTFHAGDSSITETSKLLGSIAPGFTRMWVLKDHQENQYGSSSLEHILSYLIDNKERLNHSLYYTDVREQVSEAVVQLQSSYLVKPATRQMELSASSLENLSSLLSEFGEKINPSANLLHLSSAEVKSIAHSTIINKKTNTLKQLELHRSAVAVIKKPQSTEVKLLATDLYSGDIHTQINLISKFFTNGGEIIDIETTPHKGKWSMRSLGIATSSTEGVEMHFDLSSETVNIDKARGFIQLGKRLKSLKQHKKVVASHTGYDPQHLLTEIQELENSLTTSPELLKDLKEAEIIIKDSEKEGWLDLSLLHQLRPGETGSQINQEYLAFKYLREIETHEALADANQAFKLAENARTDVLESLRHLHLTNNTTNSANPIFFMERDPRGFNFGKIVGVEGIISPIEGGTTLKVREYFPVTHNGHNSLIPGISPYEIHADKETGLVGMLGRDVVGIGKHLTQEESGIWQTAITEAADREVRNLFNIFEQRPRVKYEEYTTELAKELGPYNLLQFRATLEARSNWRSAWKLAKAMKEQHQNSSSSVAQLEVENFLPQAVDAVVGRLGKVGKTSSSQEYYINMVKKEITEILQKPFYRETISNQSTLGKFVNSTFGQSFVDSVFAGEEDPWKPMISLMFAFDKAANSFTSLPTKDYGLRLGGNLAGARVSFKLGSLDESTLQRESKKFTTWAADVLLRLDHNKDKDQASEFFGRFMDENSVKALQEAVTNLRSKKGISHAQTDQWKAALDEIVGSASSREELIIRDALRKMEEHPRGLYSAFQKLITEKQQDILASASGERELELANKLAHSGSVLLQKLEEARGQGYQKIQHVFKLALTSYKETDELHSEFLKSVGADNMQIIDAITKFTPEQVKEILEQTNSVQSKLGDVIFQSDKIDSVRQMTFGMFGFDRIKESLRLLSETGSNEVMAAASITSEIATQKASLPSLGGRVLMESLHEITSSSMPSMLEGNKEIVETIHEMTLNAATEAGRNLKIPLPLLAAGAVLAIAGAISPKSDHFTQGEQQDRRPSWQPYAARYAEIQDISKVQSTWSDDPTPWQLDITFNGFVRDKIHQEEILKMVYDSLEGHVNVKNSTTQVEDERVASHHITSRDILRRSI